MDAAEQRAIRAINAWYEANSTTSTGSSARSLVQYVAAALREAERETVERAAGEAERKAEEVGRVFSEARDMAFDIAAAIRALKERE